MQEGQLHGVARGLSGSALAYRRFEELGDGFGDAEEQQVDADPGGKQHRRPGDHVEFGFGMIRPEADLAVAAGSHDHHEEQVDQHGEKVEPAEGVGYPAKYRVDDRLGAICEEHRPYGKRHDGDCGTVENYGIDPVSRRFGIIGRELSLVHQFYLLNLFWLLRHRGATYCGRWRANLLKLLRTKGGMGMHSGRTDDSHARRQAAADKNES